MKSIYRIIVCAAVCAGLFAQDAEACTTGIISAEKSGTGRPLLWKQRDTDDYYNHMEYFKGEKYSFTALVNAYDPIREDVWIGANEKGFAIGCDLLCIYGHVFYTRTAGGTELSIVLEVGSAILTIHIYRD